MRLPIALPLTALVMLVGLVAAPAPIAAETTDPSVVRIALPADERNLNPFVAPQAQPLSHDLTMLVYDTLFWSQSSLDPDPWLATGAEPSADFRTWTVTLREGVQWHDGQPFTAADVAFTYQYFRDVGGPGRYGRHVWLHPILESATAIDDTTVELVFDRPIETFTLIPGGDLPILPRHIWEGVADPRADVSSLPIGTGPYRMVDFQPGQGYRLEANPSYFLGPPTIDVLELSVIADPSTAFTALEAGEIDFVAQNITPEWNDRIDGDANLDIIGGNRGQTVYLAFDTTLPGLADQQVRRAMSLALDVDVMLNTIEGGNGRLGTDTWTHPSSPWTRDPEASHLSDTLAAAQLLDAAGYVAPDDGTRVGADGQPLSFQLGVDTSKPRLVATADLITTQLAAIGVEVSVVPADPAAIAAARGDGPGEPPAVALLLDEVETHTQDDPDHLYFLFHSTAGGIGQRFARYANPELDAAVVEALGTSEGARIGLLQQAQDIIADDVPVVALYYPAGRIAYRPAAYDGWFSDEGHGVLTKRSLLAEFADTGDGAGDAEPAREPITIPADGSADAADDGGGRNNLMVAGFAIAALAAAVAAVAALALRFGRRTDIDDADEDELLDEELVG